MFVPHLLFSDVHGNLLRRASDALDSRVEGLAQAARRRRRSGLLSGAFAKKSIALDNACNAVRHITGASCSAFLDAVSEDIQTRAYQGAGGVEYDQSGPDANQGSSKESKDSPTYGRGKDGMGGSADGKDKGGKGSPKDDSDSSTDGKGKDGKGSSTVGKGSPKNGEDSYTDGKDTDGRGSSKDVEGSSADSLDSSADGKGNSTDGKDSSAEGKGKDGKGSSGDGKGSAKDGKDSSAEGEDKHAPKGGRADLDVAEELGELEMKSSASFADGVAHGRKASRGGSSHARPTPKEKTAILKAVCSITALGLEDAKGMVDNRGNLRVPGWASF